jgi:hypothetical protein
MKIEELTKSQLLEAFKDAVMDRNYNPFNSPYNLSGFTYDELYSEIYNRMVQVYMEPDEEYEFEN